MNDVLWNWILLRRAIVFQWKRSPANDLLVWTSNGRELAGTWFVRVWLVRVAVFGQRGACFDRTDCALHILFFADGFPKSFRVVQPAKCTILMMERFKQSPTAKELLERLEKFSQRRWLRSGSSIFYLSQRLPQYVLRSREAACSESVSHNPYMPSSKVDSKQVQ